MVCPVLEAPFWEAGMRRTEVLREVRLLFVSPLSDQWPETAVCAAKPKRPHSTDCVEKLEFRRRSKLRRSQASMTKIPQAVRPSGRFCRVWPSRAPCRDNEPHGRRSTQEIEIFAIAYLPSFSKASTQRRRSESGAFRPVFTTRSRFDPRPLSSPAVAGRGRRTKRRIRAR